MKNQYNFPTKLSKNDFEFSEVLKRGSIDIKISSTIRSISILNKKVINNDDIAISVTLPAEKHLEKLIEYIEWLGNLKEEFLDYYNNSIFEQKLTIADEKWYNNIEIDALLIEIQDDGIIQCEIIFYDNRKNIFTFWKQDSYGFWLELEDKIIKSIKFDPIL